MKVLYVVVRVLIGAMFVVFGLNGFLHFIPQSAPPPGLAKDYMTVLTASHYFAAVFAIQFVAGVLLLVNRFVPLALTIIAPVIVNILLFHCLMSPGTIAPGILVTVFWFMLAYQFRESFRGILQRMPVASEAG